MTQDTLAAANSPAQASFAFPTAPAVQEETSSQPTSGETRQQAQTASLLPAGAEPKPSPSPLRVAIILAIVTGLIGVGQSLASTFFSSSHENNKTKTQARQVLRKDILDKSSSLVLALRATRKTLAKSGVEAAAPARARYDKTVKVWYATRADMVDRAQTLFGPEFSLLIDAPGGKNIIVDKCGVVVKRDDPQRGKDCDARLVHEVSVLNARQDAVNAEKPVPAQEPGVLIPGDFTTSLKIANRLLNLVSECQRDQRVRLEGSHSPVSPPCNNLEQLQYDLNDRTNLLGLRLEEIGKRLPID